MGTKRASQTVPTISSTPSCTGAIRSTRQLLSREVRPSGMLTRIPGRPGCRATRSARSRGRRPPGARRSRGRRCRSGRSPDRAVAESRRGEPEVRTRVRDAEAVRAEQQNAGLTDTSDDRRCAIASRPSCGRARGVVRRFTVRRWARRAPGGARRARPRWRRCPGRPPSGATVRAGRRRRGWRRGRPRGRT